jgi:DNA-binding NarL/FixJ family response regulator
VLDESWERFWTDERIFGLGGRETRERRRIRVLVAHAADGWQVLELASGLLAADLGPDVVLASSELPGPSTLELEHRLQRVCPDARVVTIVADCSVAELLSAIADVAVTAIGRDPRRPVRRA